MAKQDVLDAINATIIENGQKGITAQSLNNILTMMTENAGEGGGSGDGLLRLNVPTPIIMSTIIETNGIALFNQAIWDDFIATLEEQGISYSNLNEAVTTMFAQNAEVLEQIWSKFEEGKYPVVTLDDSLMLNAYIEDMVVTFQGQNPDLTEEQIRAELELECSVRSSTLGLPMAAKEKSGDSTISRTLVLETLTNDNDLMGYPTGSMIQVFLDDFVDQDLPAGSMSFLRIPIPVSLYFPQDGATLGTEQKASNVYDYYDYSSISGESQTLIKYFTPHLVDAEGEATIQGAPFFITADFYNKKFKYFDGLSLKEAVIASDGSVTVTTLGSLTAPTA